jgi:hypothetical protein
MKTLKRFYVLSCAILLTAGMSVYMSSCKKESHDQQTPIESSATISGKVSTPNGTPVSYANVSVGNKSTHTNKAGEFTLLIPAGAQTVVIQTGNGKLFRKVIQVNLVANQSFRIPDNSCRLTQTGNLAYIPGSYDAIETILIDSLGYTATQIGFADLHDSAVLNTYSALFLNCTGLNMTDLDSLSYTNLQNFMLNGSSIYASDWAVEYFTGNGNWRPFANNHKQTGFHNPGNNTLASCMTPKIGGFVDDSSLCTSKTGITGMVYSVKILDAGMIVALGKDSIDINYNLGGWEVISVDDAPFVRTMEMVTGYPNGAVAVRTVSEGGNLYYTTFHNHPQSAVSHDIIVVLQYIILNL